jgi:hypothetical protein
MVSVLLEFIGTACRDLNGKGVQEANLIEISIISPPNRHPRALKTLEKDGASAKSDPYITNQRIAGNGPDEQKSAPNLPRRRLSDFNSGDPDKGQKETAGRTLKHFETSEGAPIKGEIAKPTPIDGT